MKKSVFASLSLVLLTAAIAVPSFTMAWIYKPNDFKIHLTSGTSVSTIEVKATKRVITATNYVNTDSANSGQVSSDKTYSIAYENIINSSSTITVLDENTAVANIELNNVDFDYLNMITNSYGVDTNYFPRIYLEFDIINEYFTSYLQANLNNFTYTLTGGTTIVPSSDSFLDYRYQLLANDPKNPIKDAVTTYGTYFDSNYYDPSLATGPSFTPILSGSSFSILKTMTNANAQLAVQGFDTKLNDANVFSNAILISIGVNPQWFFESFRSGKIDPIHSSISLSFSFSVLFSLSNQEFSDLEVIHEVKE